MEYNVNGQIISTNPQGTGIVVNDPVGLPIVGVDGTRLREEVVISRTQWYEYQALLRWYNAEKKTAARRARDREYREAKREQKAADRQAQLGNRSHSDG